MFRLSSRQTSRIGMLCLALFVFALLVVFLFPTGDRSCYFLFTDLVLGQAMVKPLMPHKMTIPSISPHSTTTNRLNYGIISAQTSDTVWCYKVYPLKKCTYPPRIAPAIGLGRHPLMWVRWLHLHTECWILISDDPHPIPRVYHTP